MELRLVAPPHFSFAEAANYLSRSPNECTHHVENGTIRKCIPVGRERPIVEITGDDAQIAVRFSGGSVTPSEEARTAVASYIREWLDLDTDLGPFYQMARNDSLLQKAVDRFYGLRLVGIPDLFEALSWGIIGQQINLAFAYTLKRRFVEAFGLCIRQQDRQYLIFPEARAIASLTVGDLTRMQFSAKKSEYLIGTAGLMAEGKLTKALLLEAGNYKDMLKQLVGIRGIGMWTANYVLMRCLRIPCAFPIDDAGLQNAIKHLLGWERKPSPEEIRRLAAAWTNWESYATFYLWFCDQKTPSTTSGR